MKHYIAPTLVTKGSTLGLTKLIPDAPEQDPSGDPDEGLVALGSVGFSL